MHRLMSMNETHDNHRLSERVAVLEARLNAPIVGVLKRDWPMIAGFGTVIAAIAGAAFGLAVHISDGDNASRGEIGSVRTELRADIGNLETELRAEIGSVRNQVQANTAALVRIEAILNERLPRGE